MSGQHRRPRWHRRIAVLAAAVALSTAGGFLLTAADASGVCTDPQFTFHGQASNGVGAYYADADIWNPKADDNPDQTMKVCSKDSWAVDVTAHDTGDGAVLSYPNVHRDYHDWSTGDEPRINSFGQITSHFEHATRTPGVGAYDVAYDLWLNGVADNDSTELMIWTDYHNQRPAGTKKATVTLEGHTFDLWAENDHQYIAYVATDPITSGTWNLKAFTDDLTDRGWLPDNSTLGQVDYGVEIVDTAGEERHWDFTGFSVDTADGPAPTTTAPTSASPTPTHTSTPTASPTGEPTRAKTMAGKVSVHPRADEPTAVHVALPAGAFDSPPVVQLTPVTSVPGSKVKGVGVTNVTARGFDVVLYRTNTHMTSVYWTATAV